MNSYIDTNVKIGLHTHAIILLLLLLWVVTNFITYGDISNIIHIFKEAYYVGLFLQVSLSAWFAIENYHGEGKSITVLRSILYFLFPIPALLLFFYIGKIELSNFLIAETKFIFALLFLIAVSYLLDNMRELKTFPRVTAKSFLQISFIFFLLKYYSLLIT